MPYTRFCAYIASPTASCCLSKVVCGRSSTMRWAGSLACIVMRVRSARSGVAAIWMMRYSPSATLRLSPPELLLEPLSESEMLPLEAEPALDADEAKLSALACRARPSAPAATMRRNGREIGIGYPQFFSNSKYRCFQLNAASNSSAPFHMPALDASIGPRLAEIFIGLGYCLAT